MQQVTNHNANKDIHEKEVLLSNDKGETKVVTFLVFMSFYASGHNQSYYRKELDAEGVGSKYLDWNHTFTKAVWN